MRVLGGQPSLDDDAFCAMLKLQKPGSKNQLQAQQDRTRQRWINACRPCRIWGEWPRCVSHVLAVAVSLECVVLPAWWQKSLAAQAPLP